jgi:hypothetical protein
MNITSFIESHYFVHAQTTDIAHIKTIGAVLWRLRPQIMIGAAWGLDYLHYGLTEVQVSF